jgi:hypothetical protein
MNQYNQYHKNYNDKYYNKYRKYKTKYLGLSKTTSNYDSGYEPMYGKDAPNFLIQNYFPLIDGVNRNDVKLNDDIRLMASNKGIDLISDIIKERMGSNITFTNLSPESYSDLINLAYKFQKVRAILRPEIDKTKNEIITHNINLYNLENRVILINKNIADGLRRTTQEVIYVDNILNNDINLGELIREHNELTNVFVFRVSTNFDFNNFFKEIKSNRYEIYSHIIDNKIKFMVMVIETMQFIV